MQQIEILSFISMTRMYDFCHGIVLAIADAFHAPSAFIKINPWFIFGALSDDGVTIAFLFDMASGTVFTEFRFYNGFFIFSS
ncbi:MAG TPA: hypothetical protein PK854_02335 [Oscillospiraceae bacterium]|nr:hypothetical protein [Oscillospiraceae bacterium]HPS34082.1 hypothetical protein [Oscillospiraceae bacterium]